MNDELNFLANDKALLVFDHLTVELHLWKIIHNQTGQIKTWQLIYANPPTLKTWGHKSLDEIKGKTTDEIFGDGSTEHYLPVVIKIMEEDQPYSYEDYFPKLEKHFRSHHGVENALYRIGPHTRNTRALPRFGNRPKWRSACFQRSRIVACQYARKRASLSKSSDA